MQALFNSKEYEWSDVKIFMFGKYVTRARAVSYKVSKEKEHLHAGGDEPHAIQSGNKSYEGSITLLQSELIALINASGKRHLVDIDAFDIIVAYGGNLIPITIDRLKHFEFTEYEKSISQGDKFQEIELPIIGLGIQENV
jgi:hypothetical protein